MQYPEHNLVTQRFPPGTVVRHYKGGMYIVVGYAREEATLDLLVLYKPFPEGRSSPDGVGMDGLPWSRPASEFTQTMSEPARMSGSVPRFSKVALEGGVVDP